MSGDCFSFPPFPSSLDWPKCFPHYYFPHCCCCRCCPLGTISKHWKMEKPLCGTLQISLMMGERQFLILTTESIFNRFVPRGGGGGSNADPIERIGKERISIGELLVAAAVATTKHRRLFVVQKRVLCKVNIKMCRTLDCF